jgi:hypothetical protein
MGIDPDMQQWLVRVRRQAQAKQDFFGTDGKAIHDSCAGYVYVKGAEGAGYYPPLITIAKWNQSITLLVLF